MWLTSLMGATLEVPLRPMSPIRCRTNCSVRRPSREQDKNNVKIPNNILKKIVLSNVINDSMH